jgi:hypothetical protein
MSGDREEVLASIVEAWNEAVRVGTPVIVIRDRGEKIRTETTSPAWVMGAHSAVVSLKGISGGYRLSRVIPVFDLDGRETTTCQTQLKLDLCRENADLVHVVVRSGPLPEHLAVRLFEMIGQQITGQWKGPPPPTVVELALEGRRR